MVDIDVRRVGRGPSSYHQQAVWLTADELRELAFHFGPSDGAYAELMADADKLDRLDGKLEGNRECPRCAESAVQRTARGFTCGECGAKFSPARWGGTGG